MNQDAGGEPLLPLHRTGVRPFTLAQAYRRAKLLVERSGLLPAVEAHLHAATGAPREFTARALLVGLATHGLRQGEMHLTKILHTLGELSTPGCVTQCPMLSSPTRQPGPPGHATSRTHTAI